MIWELVCGPKESVRQGGDVQERRDVKESTRMTSCEEGEVKFHIDYCRLQRNKFTRLVQWTTGQESVMARAHLFTLGEG